MGDPLPEPSCRPLRRPRRPPLTVKAPGDLTVTCSCGQKLEGGGPVGAFALMVQAWTEIHDRTGHVVTVDDPAKLLRRVYRRASRSPFTVADYKAFLLHHAPDPG